MFPNWLQSSIPRKSLDEKYLKISFSQNGEDDFIRSHFWSNILAGQKGTYLDIGCYQETLYSNTKLLSLVGWRGLAVDANPDLEQPWLQSRQQDQFLNRCIAPSGEVIQGLEFFRFQDGAMSTCNSERAEQLIAEGWILQDRVQVPAISLAALAKLAIEQGLSKPDLVSIDLEMVNFLADLPAFLQQLRPQLLCMECVSNTVSLRTLFSSNEVVRLVEADYEPIALIGGNIFAVPKTNYSNLSVFG